MAREMKNWTHKLHGEVPYNWKMVKLKHISTFTNGYSFKSSEYEDGEYAVITIANVQSCRLDLSNYNTVKAIPKDINPAQILKVGDMLVSMTGYVGRVCIVDKENCLLNQRVGKIRFTEKVDHIFIQYALSSGTFEEHLSFNSNGSAQQNASTYDINNFVFPLPPLAEQKVIADFLDAKCGEIDGLLADLEAEVKTLTEYKKSLIAETVTRGLNPNATMKSSGIPWANTIPAHWAVDKGKFCFELRRTKGNPRNLELMSPTQKFGVIPQSQLEGVVLVKENTDLNTFRTIRKGDFCISLRSFQGGFEYSNYEGVVSPAYQVFYPIKPIADGYFKYIFKSDGFISYINTFSMSLRDGKNIAFEDFGNSYIPIPPIEEQEAIANYLNSKCAAIEKSITDKLQQIETLKAYKSSLIYEYVTGKKQVAL